MTAPSFTIMVPLQGTQTLASYCYDANGNMTQRIVGTDTYTLTYNGENQLADVTGPASLNAAFGYDADGQRSWSDMNGVVTVYVGNTYEWNVTTGSGTSYYYAGSLRLATRQGTSVSWLLADHLGSANTTMDSTGIITGELRYLPWGETRYTSGTTPTDRRYTGQIEEPELGLYFYNARWYDPALGRFTQPDSLIPQPGSPLGWDRYAYTLNNPVNRVDPTGHKACDGKNIEQCQGFTDPTIFKSPLLKMFQSGYGYRDPVTHVGVDLGGKSTDSLYASTNGIVHTSDQCELEDCIGLASKKAKGSKGALANGGYGNLVIIEYPYIELPDRIRAEIQQGESLYIIYAHLYEPSKLSVGDKVYLGDTIGTVGNSGASDGSHLHMEVRVGAPSDFSYGQLTGVDFNPRTTLWSNWFQMRTIDPGLLFSFSRRR